VPLKDGKPDHARLDRIVAEARRNREAREKSYRERALKLYPWICGRCGREFSHATVQQLTVHHRDGNHDRNPPDGSNWELLCIYCHDAEHSRYLDTHGREDPSSGTGDSRATWQPFADLARRLKGEDGDR